MRLSINKMGSEDSVFSGIWRCVMGYSFNDVSKGRSAFIYEGQQALDQESCKKGHAKLRTLFTINHHYVLTAFKPCCYSHGITLHMFYMYVPGVLNP